MRLQDGRSLLLTTFGATIWDPVTETSTRSGRFVTPREYGPTATQLADGRVLVVGGRSLTGPGDAVRVAEIWDPSTGQFRTTGSTEAAGEYQTSGSFGVGRRQHSAVLLADGRVLVLGNSITAGGMDTAEIFELGETE
jgi:hypothetical protein